MKQERKWVTKEELSLHLTSQLQESVGALDSKIEIQFILLKQDEDGCNWSGDAVVTPGRNMSSTEISQLAIQLIKSAKAEYNLK
mgnify:CR=1 FL=1